MKELKRYKVINAQSQSQQKILIYMGLVVLGTLIGTLVFMQTNTDLLLRWDFLTQGFLRSETPVAFSASFGESFMNTAVLLAFVFTLGFSAISAPLLLLCLMYRGLALGIAISYVYSQNGLSGITDVLITTLPHAVISSLVLVFAVNEALTLSSVHAKFAFKTYLNSENVEYSGIKPYVLKFMFFAMILGASSVIDGAVKQIFR